MVTRFASTFKREPYWAIRAREISVTGDQKHLGRWMGQTIYGVRILSLASMLDLLIGGLDAR